MTRVYKSLQGITRVYKGLQEITRVYKGHITMKWTIIYTSKPD